MRPDGETMSEGDGEPVLLLVVSLSAGLIVPFSTGLIVFSSCELFLKGLIQIIEPREAGVEVGEVGIDKSGDRLVGANEFGEETPGLLLHRRLKAVDVVGGESLFGGRHGAELVQAEPLLGEEAQKSVAARRIEQAVGFAANGVGIERTFGSKRAQGVIRRTGGEEVGEAGRELMRRQ